VNVTARRFESEGQVDFGHDETALVSPLAGSPGSCRSNRPESWLPYVFTSTEEAAEAGVL
jgi:hypothetical protein